MKTAHRSVLNIQHWYTSQGVPVYFVQTPQLPIVDIRVVFHAGSARDGAKPGLADLTSGLLDEGTARLSADEIAQRFDDVGAIYQAGVRQDSAYVCLRSLTDDYFLTPALATFAQLLTGPTFAQEVVERVRKQMLTGLEEELQQPAALAHNAFYKALYATHPYGHPISGELSSIQQLSREDVIEFYQRYYTASNALVTLVGNVSKEKAQEIAEQVLKELPAGKVAAPLDLAVMAPAVSEKMGFPSQQTSVYLGQVGIAAQDADYFPLMVGNYTLGGGGMVSRLFQEVREQKGLVYGIHSSFTPLLARGPFSLKLQTRNEEAQHAIDLVYAILRQFIQDGPTIQELLAAQKNIIGGFPLELSGNSNILAQLMRIAFYKLPLDYLDTYQDKVAAVTQEQIVKAFQTHVPIDNLTKVMVGGVVES